MTEAASDEIVVETPEPTALEVEVVAETEKLAEARGEEKVHSEGWVDDKGDPGPEHTRFKDVYREKKTAEAKVEELEAAQKNHDELMVNMRDHNAKLADSMERSAKATEKLTETTIAGVEDDRRDAKSQALSDDYSNLIALKTAAMEAGDNAQIIEIDERLMDKKLEIRQFDETPAVTATKPNDIPDDKPLTDAIKKEVSRFETETKGWYKTNEMMTHAAERMENNLLNDPAWKDKEYGQILDEVKVRVEKGFNYGSAEPAKPTTPVTPPVNSVEGGGPISRTGNQVKVQLTAEQVKAAADFGISVEAYAKQVAVIAERNGQ